MNVPMKFVMDEEQLRRIRAAEGRGGRASRKEAKAWLAVVVRVAVTGLPAAKRRAPKKSAVDRATFTINEDHIANRERIRRSYSIGAAPKCTPCYDCGSTVANHHTSACEMAPTGAVRDLPSRPGTQYWTGARGAAARR